MKEKQRNLLTTIAKALISILLIYFIFTKIDLKEVLVVLKSSNWEWLIVAIALFIISKVLNSFRLNLYFKVIDVPLTQKSNLKLYLLGMFYNLFLPGGIGGDAYKGYVIQRKFKVKTKKVVGALLLDRLSGMLLIIIYCCAFIALVELPFLKGLDWLLWIIIPLGIATFWLVTKQFFSYTLPIFWNSFFYSIVIQATQLMATFCIIKAIGITSTILAYLLIFMVSSLVSVLPLTIGGIGSGEVTFLYGATWLELDINSAIGISFLFFLITALVSFFGIIFHFRKPKLETKSV